MDQKSKEELQEAEDEYLFRGQRPNEEVLFTAKQHPWVLAKRAFILLICAFIMIATIAYFGASSITSWVIFVLIVFMSFYSFYYWYLWWNGRLVLTNQRVIQSIQSGLFSKKILEAELEKIQDAVCEIKGLTNSMLNIGSIQLQTASKEKVLRLDYLFNPYDVQQKIMNAQNKNHLPHTRKII